MEKDIIIHLDKRVTPCRYFRMFTLQDRRLVCFCSKTLVQQQAWQIQSMTIVLNSHVLDSFFFHIASVSKYHHTALINASHDIYSSPHAKSPASNPLPTRGFNEAAAALLVAAAPAPLCVVLGEPLAAAASMFPIAEPPTPVAFWH